MHPATAPRVAEAIPQPAEPRPAPEPCGEPRERPVPGAEGSGTAGLEITLVVTDPEVREALAARADGRARQEFAATALRIGVLALGQAAARLDGDVVRREGERLLAELGRHLGEHRRTVAEHLSGTLREYFDPESGRFPERVERLVRRDGELEALLRRQVGAEDSELARTLARHLGEESPVLRLLQPDASDGVLRALEQSVERALGEQRERILAQFSLDDRGSALSRLVAELAERHGELGRGLEERIAEVVAEFSLDNESGALARLVGRLDLAQRQLQQEFSLDFEAGALARMRRELLDVLDGERKRNEGFQQEVREALAAMQARREEAERSTRHGEAFEAEVFRFVQAAAQRAGDVATAVGATTGAIRHCKKGDAVLELGPESAAAGARVVVEAKEDRSVGLAEALAECDVARKNREASVGLFVFSRRTAPEGLEPLARYGADVACVWDADDPASDVILRAALSVARALATRAAGSREAREADFGAIDAAIREVERLAGGLDEILTSADTVKGAALRIRRRAEILKDGLAAQLGRLEERVGDLRGASD